MCSLCSNICIVNEVSSFDIINIHIIVLGSLLGEPIHHGFHLIHYIIETHTYKHIGRSVSFQCGINIFFLLFSFTKYTKNPQLVCNKYLFT